MAITTTTVVGPVVLPDGSMPRHGVLRFTLTQWDKEAGEAVVAPGPVLVSLGEDGEFSVDLWTSDVGEFGAVYAVDLDQISVASARTRLSLGRIALSGDGPVALEALLAQPVAAPTAPDVLAQALSAQSAAQLSAEVARTERAIAEAAATAAEGDAASAQAGGDTASTALTATLLAAASQGYFATVADAEAALAEDDVFWVIDGTEMVYHQIVGGAGVEILGARFQNSEAVAAIAADAQASVAAEGERMMAISCALAEQPLLARAAILGDFQWQAFAIGDQTGLKRAVDSADIFTHTRASPASYWDSFGALQTADVDEPRYDWTGGKKERLVELGTTNRVAYSADLSQWAVGSGIGVASGDPSPKSGDTWWLVTTDGTSSQRVFSSSVAALDGEVYTGSIFVDTGQSDEQDGDFRLYVGSSGSYRTVANITISGGDLSLSYVGGGLEFEVVNSGVIDLGRGIYRIFLSAKNISGATRDVVVGIWENTDVTKTIAVWGAQLEAGSIPTSYFPTNGAPATRANDEMRILGSKISEILGGVMPGDVTLYLRGTVDWADDDASVTVRFFRWTESGGNLMNVMLRGSTDRLLFEHAYDGNYGSAQGADFGGIVEGVGAEFSIASTHRSDGSVSGASFGDTIAETSLSTGLPDLHATDLLIGSVPTQVMRIKEFALFATDIGDIRRGEITS
nr:hypothetical protein [uncultured Celeribacter sp.]